MFCSYLKGFLTTFSQCEKWDYFSDFYWVELFPWCRSEAKLISCIYYLHSTFVMFSLPDLFKCNNCFSRKQTLVVYIWYDEFILHSFRFVEIHITQIKLRKNSLKFHYQNIFESLLKCFFIMAYLSLRKN